MKYLFIIPMSFFLLLGCTIEFEKQVTKSVQDQLQLYPKSTLCDLYKNFFQDRFGPEHAIEDTISARLYLEKELASFETTGNPAIEYLGLNNNFVRVNLIVIKEQKITEHELLNAFIESARPISNDEIQKWHREWKKIVKVIEKMNLQLFDFEKEKNAIEKLLNQGKYAIHHSESFRTAYHPHYRIVEKTIFEKRLKPYL